MSSSRDQGPRDQGTTVIGDEGTKYRGRSRDPGFSSQRAVWVQKSQKAIWVQKSQQTTWAQEPECGLGSAVSPLHSPRSYQQSRDVWHCYFFPNILPAWLQGDKSRTPSSSHESPTADNLATTPPWLCPPPPANKTGTQMIRLSNDHAFAPVVFTIRRCFSTHERRVSTPSLATSETIS